MAFSCVARAQTISPSQTAEYCPNTEVTFTATVPGVYTGMASTGYVLLTSIPTSTFNSNTGVSTINFIAKFGDYNLTQGFIIYYNTATSSTSYSPVYKKIKSLYFTNGLDDCANIKPNLPTITWPVCQTSAQTISFSPMQYFNNSELNSCFGSISTYEYLLPFGWKLNGTTSDGNTWLPGNNNVSVTSDFGTGDGGAISIRALNSACGTGLANNSNLGVVHILRPKPTFTITPATVQIVCGTPKTQTFTVTQTGTTSCPVTYSWSLGLSNGWTYLGLPAPTTSFVTTTNSITLTSLALPNRINNIVCTLLVNGIATATVTSVASFVGFTPGILGGSSSICTGTSPYFTSYNIAANCTLFWGAVASLPSYGATVVQVNTPYATNTTLTKINR